MGITPDIGEPRIIAAGDVLMMEEQPAPATSPMLSPTSRSTQ
jgi:hypothetical protein